MNSELDKAEDLDRLLSSDIASAINNPEFAAMHSLAGEISGAIGGSWLNPSQRTRLWMAAKQPQLALHRRLIHRPSGRSMLAGAGALTLSAAVGWAVIHHRRTHRLAA